MKSYGQFCPIAKAAEILSERWTLLLLRDLLLGSRHFNEIRRGVPQMSPTLLSKRPQTLQEHGIVSREACADGHGWEYRITPAGEELKPLIEFLGHWGQRWVRSTLVRDDLDPGVLMWFIHRHFAKEHLPSRRVVIHLEFSDVRRMKRWWIVVEPDDVDLCLEDPGHDVDINLVTDLRTLTQIYLGDLLFSDAVSSRAMKVEGPAQLTRTMPRWFARSKFADTRPAEMAGEGGASLLVSIRRDGDKARAGHLR